MANNEELAHLAVLESEVDMGQYDGQISIAVGDSRQSINWKNKEMMWTELVSRLAIPTRTPETQIEFFQMPKARQGDIKDVGGFVGGTLKSGRRKAENVLQRRLLTLDLDHLQSEDDPWPTAELILGNAAILYSTHSHTLKSPRLRLVFPLSRPVTPDEYVALSRRIAGDIGIDMCDDTTYEPHRLMYWPSVSIDAPYRYEVLDGPWLDVDEHLGRYTDWRDVTQWPMSSRKSEIIQRLAKKQGDPTEKNGIVGAFCRIHSVDDAIEQFLPETYVRYSDNRYSFTGSTCAGGGGLVVYEDGKFAYSHYGSDPVSGKLCNSFDLIRLHMFGDQDDTVTAGTPVVKLPSYVQMAELALNDAVVRENLTLHRLEQVTQSLGEGEDTNWVRELSVSTKGEVKSTIDNVLIIMKNDPKLKGKYHYDEFRERPVAAGDLPWQKEKDRITDCWSDTDDAGLRQYLEKLYKIDSAVKIRDAVELAMLQEKRHPVREYLSGLVWDGKNRADTVFIDYLDAADTKYTREVTRKALIGAVARIFNPGCKHDHILVLVGPQGCRKSTTLVKLGKDWFSDSLYTLSGKDAYEQLQGNWIIEMGEMAATRKAELEQIKQFISKQSDSYRAAYARRTQEHPRQCAFFGSTNDDEFLRDPTGARRFWPVVVSGKGKVLNDSLTDEVVDQIWAETVTRYLAGETWYLNDEVETMAKEAQAQHTETNGKLGLIENFLEMLVPKGWAAMDFDERLLFLNGGFGESPNGTERREKVCALEVWQELFKGDPKSFSQVQAREINNILRQCEGWKISNSVDCGKIYGRQRAFIRITN